MILTNTADITIKPRRIISLVPSITELLYDLGLEDETIGITKFCVHPAHWFRSKTRIGGTKQLHLQQIIGLQPDLLIANKEENMQEQVEALAKHFRVWVTDVGSYEAALQMIRDTGKLTHSTEKASALVKEIGFRFRQIDHMGSPLKTAYLIWKDPWMTIGGDTYISDMMAIAGLENVFADRERYPTISMEELENSGCRLVLLSSEPYPFKQKHIDELAARLPGIKILPADGEMFSWYGSRLLQVPAYLQQLRKLTGQAK